MWFFHVFVTFVGLVSSSFRRSYTSCPADFSDSSMGKTVFFCFSEHFAKCYFRRFHKQNFSRFVKTPMYVLREFFFQKSALVQQKKTVQILFAYIELSFLGFWGKISCRIVKGHFYCPEEQIEEESFFSEKLHRISLPDNEWEFIGLLEITFCQSCQICILRAQRNNLEKKIIFLKLFFVLFNKSSENTVTNFVFS